MVFKILFVSSYYIFNMQIKIFWWFAILIKSKVELGIIRLETKSSRISYRKLTVKYDRT